MLQRFYGSWTVDVANFGKAFSTVKRASSSAKRFGASYQFHSICPERRKDFELKAVVVGDWRPDVSSNEVVVLGMAIQPVFVREYQVSRTVGRDVIDLDVAINVGFYIQRKLLTSPVRFSSIWFDGYVEIGN